MWVVLLALPLCWVIKQTHSSELNTTQPTVNSDKGHWGAGVGLMGFLAEGCLQVDGANRGFWIENDIVIKAENNFRERAVPTHPR